MRLEADIATLQGDIVLANATRLLAEGEAAISAGAKVFDLSSVANVDSSALSLLLSLRRRAGDIEFRHVPPSLVSLATLYGIDQQI